MALAEDSDDIVKRAEEEFLRGNFSSASELCRKGILDELVSQCVSTSEYIAKLTPIRDLTTQLLLGVLTARTFLWTLMELKMAHPGPLFSL